MELIQATTEIFLIATEKNLVKDMIVIGTSDISLKEELLRESELILPLANQAS